MIPELFYWLFNMSITASVVGGVILLIRLIKKIPRRVISLLWLIPFFRLWVPVGINGKYGLISLLMRLSTKTAVFVPVGELQSFSVMNSVMAADDYFPIEFKTYALGELFRVASVIWLIGFCACALTFTVLYVITVREMKGAKRLYGNVYTSDKITSPAVYGVFKPRVVIPEALCDNVNLKYYLMHENAHIKRLDNFWRIVAFLTAALHWFNPFCWIFLKCFLNDLELSCDEKVLQSCGDDERKNYALALVSFEEEKTLFVSAFGGAKIRTRVERILSFSKISVASAVVFGLMIAATAYILLTNAG